MISNPELLSRILNYNLEKNNISSTLKTEALHFLRNFLSLTDQLHSSNYRKMTKISIRWELCTYSKKAIFFTISVGMSCRGGSNTLLFTNKQYHQFLRLVLIIWSHDIFKLSDFILYPPQIVAFFFA